MTPIETYLFFASALGYAIGAVLFTLEFFRGAERPDRRASVVTQVAFVLHTASLLVRCASTGYAPMTNMYESLSFFAWGTVIAVLVVRWRKDVFLVSAFTAPIYLVLMVLAYYFKPERLTGLIPALQSWLLPAHVMLAFLGEAWFIVGFAAAVMYLLKSGAGEGWFVSRLPDKKVLDSISYRAISLGYPLFTLGALILGMVWAHRAWGRYWGWDPKEVWALITFIVYSLYLHGRLRLGWRGRVSAYLAVIGFIVTMFTLFGVNLLLSGLHSYAK